MSGDADDPRGRYVWALFRGMVVEEWRMHADLFGGRRFAAFPAFVTLVVGGGVALLTFAGVDLPTVLAGVHVLVLLFGLQTGTVGFLGRDAMQNLVGDTLLVFSSRTLPVGRRETLGVFLLSDLAYYSVLFMVPLSLAFVPSVLLGELSPGRVGLLWLTLTATFALGIAVTLLVVALLSRGVPEPAAVVGLVAVVGLAWAAGVDPLAATPYALFVAPSPAAAATLAAIPALVALAAVLYDPDTVSTDRTAGDAFGRWQGRLAPLGDGDGLTTRSLLDVSRSSGGLLKVAFSAGVLFVVSAFLVELVAPIVGTDPSTGITFGALLGLSAFTTFNWLTQFDDPAEYLGLPVDLGQVFAAKLRAFLVLSVPTGLLFLAVAAVWLGGQPREVVVGTLLLVGLQVYLFGVVVYLTGFSPNEFLFDTVLFAAFGVAVAVPIVPVLVVGLVVSPVTPPLLLALAAGAVVAAGVGVALYRRGVPKWTRAYRSGTV